jgi:hypothetical protein
MERSRSGSTHLEQRVFSATEAAERRVADVGLFLTLMTLVFWLFLPGVAFLGPRSWLWIPVGLAIIGVALPLAFAVFHERRRLEVAPGARIAFKLLQVSRGGFALIGAGLLFRAVVRASEEDASWGAVGEQLMKILGG